MANRHLFRSIILQTLFELDIQNFIDKNIESLVEYNVKSFSSSPADDNKKIIEAIVGILDKKDTIDEVIEKAAPDWPLNKITIIDRNILRLSIYELLFVDRDTVPAKVSINEAVELAKQFGGPKSSRFVNGVIGAVYRELGEPGKDEYSKKKYEDIPLEDMEIDKKGAAVVYSIDSNGIPRIGMVHDIFGYWTLSKGSIEKGETEEEATIREIKEETDWNVEIISKLGSNEYIAYHPKRGPVRKQVQYFLAKSDYTKPTLDKNPDLGGLDDVRWFDFSEISDLNMYDDVSKMLIKAIEIITEKHLLFNKSEMVIEDDSVKKDIIDASLDIDLSSMKITDLKEIAKNRGLSGYSSLKKNELVKLLLKK